MNIDRNLALEFVRVTEYAALASAKLMGRGDEKAADQAAVDAMRSVLDTVSCRMKVVIGEGERDEAPMLYIGEEVGGKNQTSNSSPIARLELALDPLEGTTICATGGYNAISVLAVASEGNFLHAPDTYMKKIATGPIGKGVIHINNSALENLGRLAEVKKCSIGELTVVILDRPRHEALIHEVRETGARICLIGDGDVSAALATCYPETGIDILMGTGGAPEGVIAAAALRCVGGEIQGILQPRNKEEIIRANKMGIKDVHRVLVMDDLARGDVLFAATGVTDGSFLRGVKFRSGGATTHSLVMRSSSGTVRHVTAEHNLTRKPFF